MAGAMLAFKEPHLIHHWGRLHPRAIEVVEWIAREVWMQKLGQLYLVVTSVYYEGGSGVHADYRAVDISARDCCAGFTLGHVRCHEAEAAINQAWDHGSGGRFNVCWFHKAPGSAWHFHVQVRDSTRMR